MSDKGATGAALRGRPEIEIASISFSIGDAWAKVSVFDHYGPTIKINTAAFGNLASELNIATDQVSMRALGEMLIEASCSPFSGTYVHAAKVRTASNREDDCAGDDSMHASNDSAVGRSPGSL